MKRKSVVSLAVGMAAILLLSLFVMTLASSAKAGSDRPFKATLAGSVYWEFPGESPSNCEVVTTLSDISGQATHMGRVETFWSHCPAEPDYVDDGKIRLVAANGDELYGTYDYDPNDESNEIPITLAGGTGSFADASGAIVVTYVVIPQFLPDCNPETDDFYCFDLSVSWPWSGTMTGTISY